MLTGSPGVRPGEGCSMCRSGIDTSGPVWMYRPSRQKLSYRGQEGVGGIGPESPPIPKAFVTPTIHVGAAKPRVFPFGNRTNCAADVRRRFGPDAAQPGHGHSKADVTQVYAEANSERDKSSSKCVTLGHRAQPAPSSFFILTPVRDIPVIIGNADGPERWSRPRPASRRDSRRTPVRGGSHTGWARTVRPRSRKQEQA